MSVDIQTIIQSNLPQGESGYSGISGYSGYSGISGYSGSGISGYSGYSGISGYSGFSGISGFSGFSGISGYSGDSGISGYSGYSGISGFSGISGYSGYSGISGFSGESGISGWSGISGYSGAAFIGSSGYSGYSGISGFSGATGSPWGGGTFTGDITLSNGTANGVAYLNGSKVLTTGTALTFDGTNFGVGIAPTEKVDINGNLQQRNGAGVTIGKVENASGWYSLTADSSNVNGVQLSHGTAARIVVNGSERIRVDISGNMVLKTGSLQEVKTAVAASDINLSLGNFFSKTISGATTFTVSNVPTTGTSIVFILDLTNGGSSTITWWSGVKWAAGTPPTLTVAGRDVLAFFTYDGGTTWTGMALAKDAK